MTANPIGFDLTDLGSNFGNAEGDENNWVGEKKYLSPQGIALDVNPSGWRMFPGGKRGED